MEDLPPPISDVVMPIAIIGISGRFPGDAENPQKLWDMIAAGRSALGDIPPDRFNIDAYYHPHNERQGTMNMRKAHFMKRDIKAFDAPFFTIPIAEAESMDPQQRMALECTYEALENAGLRIEDVNGSNTSCFVGCFTRDYSDMIACDPEDVPMLQGTGTGSAIMSNRISWFFNMKGPSISLDTACSSSLVALHLGCQSLRTGETTMSVVGGTNLMLVPGIMSAMASLHFLSPDGKCQPFDHKGNGYSRGEGAAFCVLKPLHLALEDGDVIRGVIRNSAVSSDGNTPGITVPSGDAQEALIRRVYSEAGLSLAETQYVEAHGTGTPAGDPVEAGALARTFGAARIHGDPLYIGSVKSNVGHLEGGSGIVQVVKAIQMLEKGQIPPSIWYEKPNPRIPMTEWNLVVPTQLLSWPTSGARRISINSFGYGGTNAHCVIDDAYHYMKARRITGNHNVQVNEASFAPSVDSGVDVYGDEEPSNFLASETLSSATAILSLSTESEPPRPRLLVWTSNEEAGVGRSSKIYAEYLRAKVAGGLTELEEETLLTKFAGTLAARRSILPWRSFAVASSCEEAIELLEKPPVKAIRTSNMKTTPMVAFVFTGQGAQWFAMGRELFAQPVFKTSLEAADTYFVEHLGASWSLISEMCCNAESSRIESPDLSQPVCTALQVALVDLLASWGIKPNAVMGHSSGEIAAAYAKGAISREDAWKIAYHRGYVSNRICDVAPALEGAMLAIGLGPEDAEPYIARVSRGKATIACINSLASTTLSGDSTAIDELEHMIQSDGHFARRLRVGVAYHSPHMQAIEEQHRQALGKIDTLSDDGTPVQMFSSLTGARIDNNAVLGAEYWVSNMLNKVKFSEALQSLLNYTDGKSKRRRKKAYVQHLIEIGPHAALKGPIQQVLAQDIPGVDAADVSYQSVLARGKNASETILTVAGRLFQHGFPFSVNSILNGAERQVKGGFLVDMPPFAWNHNLTYWAENSHGKAYRFPKHSRKDLFGKETQDAIPEEPRFRNILRLNEVPWMKYHTVQGSVLYPAAGMMIMAIEAMCQKADQTRVIEGYELRDVLIGKAILVPDDFAGVETMLTLKPFRNGTKSRTATWQEFQLYSRKEVWELNCSGLIQVVYQKSVNPVFANEEVLANERYAEQYRKVREGCFVAEHPRHFYDHLSSIGLHYGGVFHSLTEIRKGDYSSACRVKIPDTKSGMPHQFEFPHVIHPATLDSMIQMALPASCRVDEEVTVPIVPVAIGRLYVSADVPSEPGVILTGYATSETETFGSNEGSTIVVSNEKWEKPLVIFEGVQGKKFNAPATASSDETNLRKIGTCIQWQEDISLLDRQQMKILCAAAVGDAGHVDRQVLVDIEIACMIFIKRVLNECSTKEAEGFAWNFKLFYDYMQHCHTLALSGKLCYQRLTPEIDWLSIDSEAEEELLARVSKTSSGGRALVHHGRHLPQILRGEIPPLQVLMQENFLHDYYQAGIGTEQHYAQMCWYVDLLAHKNPNMKILEIGGGTGAASLPVLTKLGGANGTAPRFSRYTFTDISAGYFEKARTKLGPWMPFLDFARLNIEEDPVAQGFKEGEYDLIVASNVLHATRFIRETLENTRKLLKPNGKLVLTEVTPFQNMRFHMVVGSLEGWWYGEDDGRHMGPTLEVDQWDTALKQAGFDGVEIDFQDFPDPKDTGLSVIVSGASPRERSPTPNDVLIVVSEAAEPETLSAADEISKRLRQRGSKVATVLLQNTAALALKDKSCLCLLDTNQDAGFLTDISRTDWSSLKNLILNSRDITYVTRGATVQSKNPSGNLMSGMARSIRSENYGLSFTTVDAEFGIPLGKDETVSAILKAFEMSGSLHDTERPDWEYAIRDGVLLIQRVLLEKGVNDLAASWHLVPTPVQGPFQQEGRPLSLNVGTPGRLDTIRFEDDFTATEKLGADEVEIIVKAAGLNFKDVMVAMGELSQPTLGLECAGIVSRVGSNVTGLELGAAVMTWKMGTFRNVVRASAAMVQLVPDGMDLASAASIPLIYSTAHYALSTVAQLRHGETVLIHGGAGGVGQAAIVLAQHIGAIVFVSVSSEAKKTLVAKTYGIPSSHILNSRDSTSFARAVRRLTNGKGVNVVLNSLAGEALRLGWRAIARFGRFVELGQRDIVGNTGLDMEPFLRNVSFHSVNMLDLLDWNLDTAARVFTEVVELQRDGVVKPVTPIQLLPFSRVEEAFRLMQTGKHIGKIVLEAREDDVVSVLPTVRTPVRFQSDATYVIAGGGGGIGRATAAWMVKSGAKNVLLLSRSGTKKAAARELVTHLNKQGARVEVWPCDVANEQQLVDVLARCQAESWPPIRGVIQGAMVLQDAIYENMTREQFNDAIGPKVYGSWNIHKHFPQNMDFYVLLSSSYGYAGARSQGNYSAGNAYQDALAHYRRGIGLAAVTIDVGMVLGVGFLAEDTTTTRVHDNVMSWSFLGISEREFLGVLEIAIRGESLPGVKIPAQLLTGLGTGGMINQNREKKEPWWFKDAKFAHIGHVDTQKVTQDENVDMISPSLLLAQSTSMDQAVDIVTDALIKKLAKSLMFSADDVEAVKPVNAYGVDSLLAVELRSWIYSELKAEVSVFDLLSNTPITSLASKIATTSKVVPHVNFVAENE